MAGNKENPAMPDMPLPDPRYTALAARDPAADGLFVYAVVTTGVACRPSCAARTPRPGNVRFFADLAEAEAAGFRPCKRCRPDRADEPGLAERACRLIEAADEALSLEALASALGVSPSHLHRRFKAATGLSPRGYAAALRARRLAAALPEAMSVTDAIYAAGYSGPGRFYEDADTRLAMTPTRYRAGGEGERIAWAVAPSSLGLVLVAATARGVCAILLGDDRDALAADLGARFGRAELVEGGPALGDLVAQAVALVERPRAGPALPLDISGTAFQERVWQALRAIPAGETVSYAAFAARIGRPSATRAVAQACGANKLAVAIPCHRVVGADGGLGGYRWGVERKRALLDRELESSLRAEGEAIS